MAIRNIVQFGDSVLEKECRKVEKFDARLHQLLDDMKETLADANGAGLAAPQVGVLRAVCVVDVGEGPIELVNPEIIKTSGEQTGTEGCLSYPDHWGIVTRPMKVTVKAQDRNGKWFQVTGEELCARAFCHEIDHLHGVLFRSHATRMMTTAELEAEAAAKEENHENDLHGDA
ncbi:peptide deformylase [Neglectibacter caecimuris]|jgi:peptide deformylase|uniref:peptide deformylase n=1 Tax=Neglectibacter caecimuris TaxID=3093658 RepID=UPI002AC9AE8B|nr:peptide deformylase [Neglectibacter sp. M00184]